MLEVLEVPVAALPVGLKPPGSIEVAPRGIPVGNPEGVEPTAPSGDVIPSPGALNTLCAKLAWELSRIAAVTTIASRIEIS